MGDYESIARDFFKKVLSRYNLKFIRIDEDSFALVGWRFAIGLYLSLDGVTLVYILPNADGSLDEYWFDTYISKKFDDNDQFGIGNPQTINEIIIAELKISASGLLNHCENILQGDKSWMKDFMQDRSGGTYKANEEVVGALGPIFDKQKK